MHKTWGVIFTFSHYWVCVVFVRMRYLPHKVWINSNSCQPATSVTENHLPESLAEITCRKVLFSACCWAEYILNEWKIETLRFDVFFLLNKSNIDQTADDMIIKILYNTVNKGALKSDWISGSWCVLYVSLWNWAVSNSLLPNC